MSLVSYKCLPTRQSVKTCKSVFVESQMWEYTNVSTLCCMLAHPLKRTLCNYPMGILFRSSNMRQKAPEKVDVALRGVVLNISGIFYSKRHILHVYLPTYGTLGDCSFITVFRIGHLLSSTALFNLSHFGLIEVNGTKLIQRKISNSNILKIATLGSEQP